MTQPLLSIHPAALLAAAFLSPAALLAQTVPPTALTAPMRTPIRPGPDAPDGTQSGLWAAGADYKVSFHDGMTFYPRVGPSLPHQPLRWRTSSVRAGAQELLPAATQPRAVCGDYRCDYEFGPITERYDVREDGLEQSFVIHDRPTAGDLVITGTIETPLVLPTTTEHHGPLALSLPDGRSVIGYGTATAIDARGRHLAVTTATEGNRIMLRLAAESVATAAFPLLVDPLLTTNALLGLGAPMQEVDVLHETLSTATPPADLWYAWATEFAAGDHDLRLWRSGGDWTTTVTEQYREITNWDSRHGRIALAPGSQCVVLVHSMDSGTNRWVVVHRHNVANNFLVTSSVLVPQPPSGVSSWRPDVGGHLDAAGSKVLITFQREAVSPFANTDTSTGYGTVFDTAIPNINNGFVVQPFVLLTRPNADQERCVVNQSAGGDQWLVAFQELNNQVANDDWDITTVAVDATGTVVPTGLDTAQAGDPLQHKIDPELAGAAGRYTLTYTTRAFELANPKPAAEFGNAVYAQRLDWNHTTGSGSLPWPAVTLHSLVGNGAANAGIAFDPTSRSHWCAGLQLPVTNRYRVFKLGYTGEVVESGSIQLSASSTPVALAASFSRDPRRFPIVYADNTAIGAQSVVRGTFLTYASLTPPALVGTACGSGVWAGLQATAERQQIGAQSMPLRLSNAPNDTFAALAFSTAQANTPGALVGLDGCVLVPDIAAPNFWGLLVAPIVNGEASVSINLPPALSPVALVLQWGYFVSPPLNPLGMQLSEGLIVNIDR